MLNLVTMWIDKPREWGQIQVGHLQKNVNAQPQEWGVACPCTGNIGVFLWGRGGKRRNHHQLAR